ncbi:MAG: phosphate/phosphite/phosphonate ABC transporter substrate-binding protein [Thermodesulfovibrionia bacterium]|nr:phosphate/phosphite/phosphonate ABC transporter substrate-binding protein [Thermodesulfovibrionia bacterium]
MRIILAIIAIFIFSTQSHAAEELNIGLIPEQNVFKQMKKYEPLGKYIENKTGVKLNFIILSRYGNIIDNFNSMNLDGAFWGSFTGAMAIKKLNIQPIARPVNPDGNSSYQGYIFVHKDSRIDSVARMKNSVIAFVDKATTAGYIFPMAYFRENGVTNIDSYFKEHFFAGSHDAAIYAVLNKEATVGCAKNTIFDMLAKEDPSVKNDLVILAKSPFVPSNGLGIKSNIAISVRNRLQAALLGMSKDPEGIAVLEKFGAREFISTTKEDYQPVFDMINKAGIDLDTYNYRNK